MQDANVDYIYEEYKDQVENENSVTINGQNYEFNAYDFEKSSYYVNKYNNDNNYNMFYESYVEKYLEQRPDLNILYDEIIKQLNDYRYEYFELLEQYGLLFNLLNNFFTENLIEKYNELNLKKEELENKILLLESKKCEYMIDGYNYSIKLSKINNINDNIELLLNDTNSYDDEKYSSLLEEKEFLEQELEKYICSSISLDDIKDKLKNYNSSFGKVPAGEWDTWTNPKYEGYGYETGMTGSFEGPQGKETGYDSRKGAIKTNYKNPDSSLLQFLSNVTDSEGKILYPIESFEKGGEFYYHIFGVNDDGSINKDLINNPRFGCKMLGNYLLVGADQRLNRERGSKVMTSLGPAIVFDYGTIDDTSIDPGHIDISMDEVLFWLKDFSHNKDKKIESLAGVYDWCTSYDYSGTIDINYEHMERNYVSNLNMASNGNLICIFDRDDFENETSYNSQEEFVYSLKY